MLKTAIVGCGGVAEVHAECVRELEGAELVACADTLPGRAAQFAGRFGGEAYEDLDGMLAAARPDVLHICTPHFLHVPIAVKAHSLGIDVFMEKPPATSRAECAALEGLGDGARLGFCFQNRYGGAVARLAAILREGTYGAPKGARAFVTWRREAPYYTDSGWRGTWDREGGGVLVNQSIHTLDLLAHLLGRPASVDARCANHHLKGVIQVEDTVEAYIRFKGGIPALFYATTGYCEDSPVLLEVSFEGGRVRMEGETLAEYPESGAPILSDHTLKHMGKDYWGAGHMACIKDFYRCLVDGGRFPIGYADVRDTLGLLIGIYESSITGQEIIL